MSTVGPEASGGLLRLHTVCGRFVRPTLNTQEEQIEAVGEGHIGACL